ncbi:MAG: hypothetical protein II777_00320, partial [Clostridia bacterium]|nr:hypothetical protein [Clostridia bacterium]
EVKVNMFNDIQTNIISPRGGGEARGVRFEHGFAVITYQPSAAAVWIKKSSSRSCLILWGG